jgi:L-2-hydroxyglutarate oxidase
VLAFAREGYRKRDVDLREFWETVRYPGFRKLAGRYWQTGLGEMWRSISKRAFVAALQRLVPAIEARHLLAMPAGVRAQAITPTGALVDDFAFRETARGVHVLNAPSPAATASLEIGRIISSKIVTRLDLS